MYNSTINRLRWNVCSFSDSRLKITTILNETVSITKTQRTDQLQMKPIRLWKTEQINRLYWNIIIISETDEAETLL